jgi:16S rRNA (adenine1518-N6/adenine1519-N6)-dimethyltransferase
VRPRKRFGQHFLEAAWVDKLVAVIGVAPDDTLLEIGPGRGALTKPLARLARLIVAIEIDRDLAGLAAESFPPNVRVVEGDVLDVDLAALVAGLPLPVRVVGNLPYNISSPILFALLGAADGGRLFRDATLMLQKEVADRLVARPGMDGYGSLAVQAGLTSDVEHLLTLPPGAFRPAPAVTSAVVRMRFRSPGADQCDLNTFERLVRGAFLQRRKTLQNALKPVAATMGQSATELIERAGLDGSLRPEALTVSDFARLARAVL